MDVRKPSHYAKVQFLCDGQNITELDPDALVIKRFLRVLQKPD